MGLLKSGINEVIATTAGNAAPVGIHYRGGKAHAVLFAGSHTAANVARDGWLVANFIHDPLLYVTTAFEDLPASSFVTEPVDGLQMQRLAGAEAWVACTAMVEKTTDGGALFVTLEPKKEIIEGVHAHPVNRGFGNLIDATVHATRYRIREDPELLRLMEYHATVVRKCGGKREREALEKLSGYLGKNL